MSRIDWKNYDYSEGPPKASSANSSGLGGSSVTGLGNGNGNGNEPNPYTRRSLPSHLQSIDPLTLNDPSLKHQLSTATAANQHSSKVNFHGHHDNFNTMTSSNSNNSNSTTNIFVATRDNSNTDQGERADDALSPRSSKTKDLTITRFAKTFDPFTSPCQSLEEIIPVKPPSIDEPDEVDKRINNRSLSYRPPGATGIKNNNPFSPQSQQHHSDSSPYQSTRKMTFEDDEFEPFPREKPKAIISDSEDANLHSRHNRRESNNKADSTPSTALYDTMGVGDHTLYPSRTTTAREAAAAVVKDNKNHRNHNDDDQNEEEPFDAMQSKNKSSIASSTVAQVPTIPITRDNFQQMNTAMNTNYHSQQQQQQQQFNQNNNMMRQYPQQYLQSQQQPPSTSLFNSSSPLNQNNGIGNTIQTNSVGYKDETDPSSVDVVTTNPLGPTAQTDNGGKGSNNLLGGTYSSAYEEVWNQADTDWKQADTSGAEIQFCVSDDVDDDDGQYEFESFAGDRSTVASSVGRVVYENGNGQDGHGHGENNGNTAVVGQVTNAIPPTSILRNSRYDGVVVDDETMDAVSLDSSQDENESHNTEGEEETRDDVQEEAGEEGYTGKKKTFGNFDTLIQKEEDTTLVPKSNDIYVDSEKDSSRRSPSHKLNKKDKDVPSKTKKDKRKASRRRHESNIIRDDDDDDSIDDDKSSKRCADTLQDRTKQAWSVRNRAAAAAVSGATKTKDVTFVAFEKNTVHEFVPEEVKESRTGESDCDMATEASEVSYYDDDNSYAGRSVNSFYTKSAESEFEDMVKDFFLIGRGEANNPGRRKLRYKKQFKFKDDKYESGDETITTVGGDTEDQSAMDDSFATPKPVAPKPDTLESEKKMKKAETKSSSLKKIEEDDEDETLENEEEENDDPLSVVWNILEDGVNTFSSALGLEVTTASTPPPTPTRSDKKVSSNILLDTPEKKRVQKNIGESELLRLASTTVRIHHELKNVVYDETSKFDVNKDIKIVMTTIALPIGIMFEETNLCCWVAKVFTSGNAASNYKGDKIAIGDQLTAINGISTTGRGVPEVCQILSDADDPTDIQLTFLRYVGNLRPLIELEQQGYEVIDPILSDENMQPNNRFSPRNLITISPKSTPLQSQTPKRNEQATPLSRSSSSKKKKPVPSSSLSSSSRKNSFKKNTPIKNDPYSTPVRVVEEQIGTPMSAASSQTHMLDDEKLKSLKGMTGVSSTSELIENDDENDKKVEKKKKFRLFKLPKRKK